MTLPDNAAIRAMSGPALTHLALDLDLQPDDYECIRRHTAGGWHPNRNLTQAREIFLDRLRSLGMITTYTAGHCRIHFAVYTRGEAKRFEDNISTSAGRFDTTVLAVALLRCACLAAASVQRKEGHELE